jgi:hypothetical protein
VIKGEQCHLSMLSQPQMFPIFSSSGLLFKLALVHSANQLPIHRNLLLVCANIKQHHWFFFIMSFWTAYSSRNCICLLFTEWLVDLEVKGLKVFGDYSSCIMERFAYDGVKNGHGNMIHSDADLFFFDKQSGREFMDTKGSEDEAVDEMETAGNNAFMAAAQSMKGVTDGMRKRKSCGYEDATAVKFVKYKVEDSSLKDYLSAANGISSGSEVENPQSDDEMEESN